MGTGSCQRTSARTWCSSGASPATLHSPASGSSRRVAANARCAATASNPDQRATQADRAAGRSAAGTAEALCCANKRSHVASRSWLGAQQAAVALEPRSACSFGSPAHSSRRPPRNILQTGSSVTRRRKSPREKKNQCYFDAEGNTGSNSKPSKLHPHTAPEHDSHNFYTTRRHGPACGGADQAVVAHAAQEMCRAVGKPQNLEEGGEVDIISLFSSLVVRTPPDPDPGPDPDLDPGRTRTRIRLGSGPTRTRARTRTRTRTRGPDPDPDPDPDPGPDTGGW